MFSDPQPQYSMWGEMCSEKDGFCVGECKNPFQICQRNPFQICTCGPFKSLLQGQQQQNANPFQFGQEEKKMDENICVMQADGTCRGGCDNPNEVCRRNNNVCRCEYSAKLHRENKQWEDFLAVQQKEYEDSPMEISDDPFHVPVDEQKKSQVYNPHHVFDRSQAEFKGEARQEAPKNYPQFPNAPVTSSEDLVLQIIKVYRAKLDLLGTEEQKDMFDKQILKFLILFSRNNLGALTTIEQGTPFVRTVNKHRPIPNKNLIFMNANARGNLNIPGSRINGVVEFTTTKPLRVMDLTKLAYLLGSQIKAGRDDTRGVFSSCCKTKDIIAVCNELGIDGIIGFDSVDSVDRSMFVGKNVSENSLGKKTLPESYFRWVRDDSFKNRAVKIEGEEGTHYCYPEFTFVNIGLGNNLKALRKKRGKKQVEPKMKKTGQLNLYEFYSNEKYYAANFNGFSLPEPKMSANHRRRASPWRKHDEFKSLKTFPMMANEDETVAILEKFVDELTREIPEHTQDEHLTYRFSNLHL